MFGHHDQVLSVGECSHDAVRKVGWVSVFHLEVDQLDGSEQAVHVTIGRTRSEDVLARVVERLPRPVTPERRIAIREAILRIENLVDRGDDATAAIETLNATTGHRFRLDDFRDHCGAPDREELIERASAPPPVRLPDITRDELVELVRHILADPTDDWYIEAFERNTVRPGASDLIFHPPPELRDATAEQIVDAALAYRPIAL
jgi:hypothetical protein